MKMIIHDLGSEYNDTLNRKADMVIWADGKYAPCQGCFHCWTKNPATCDLKDSLQEMCRIIGQADDLTIITQNWYGGYSPAIKNLLDRSIGTSTPFSTYRGREMHHTLRYGKHKMEPIINFGKQLLEVLIFGCGIITFDIWLAICINRGKSYGKHYTRIMLPSFVFIIAADIFFFVISVFSGGIFRGWLARKKPSLYTEGKES